MDNFNVFIRSILAGICIGLGGAIFMKLTGIIGAIMFAFGLLTVVHFKLPLYTGTAGFIECNKLSEWTKMLIILCGNIIGCVLLYCLFDSNTFDATNIIQARLDAGYFQSFMNAIGCGLIMTLIVKGGRDNNLLLILFGIPIFILLGFYHSIADAFYATWISPELLRSYCPTYLLIVLGNFVGCNIPRLLNYTKY